MLAAWCREDLGALGPHCRPGIEGAHQKGAVEGQIGFFRRNHFVPVPEVSSLGKLNEMVEQWDRQDDARRIGARSKTVAECFAFEQLPRRPLPDEPFETGRMFKPQVDRHSQIPVRTNRCSVPIRLIGSVTDTSHRVSASCPHNDETRSVILSAWPSRWRIATVPDQPSSARYSSAKVDALRASSGGGSTCAAYRFTTSPAE